MGKFHKLTGHCLGLLCAAAFAVPALANTLSVDVSPTTGYSVTNRSTTALPPRATSGPITTYNPTLGPRAGGGAYQTTSSGITITAIKDGAAATTTMGGRVNATAAAMANGLKRCFTSMRCNLALAAGAAGVDAFLDGIDWVMGEGGRPVAITPPTPGSGAQSCDDFPGSRCAVLSGPGNNCVFNPPNSTQATCRAMVEPQAITLSARFPERGNYTIYCTTFESQGRVSCQAIFERQMIPGNPQVLGSLAGIIPSSDPAVGTRGLYVYGTPVPDLPTLREPLSPDEISDAVDSSYTPDPSDLPFLSTGGLDFSDPGVEFEITDIPSISGADNPTITTYPDGSSSSTHTDFDFSWSGPSKQPEVTVEEKTTEQTYSPTGEPTGSTTTTVSIGGSVPPPEIPTDCNFMPTVCRFIDWFTEPDSEVSQDVDFTQLIDSVEVDKDYSVGSSTASCPEPFIVNLSWVPSVEISLQPFCDLADLLRPVLLAIAALVSGAIILRT